MSSYLINGNGKQELSFAIKQVIRHAKKYIKACNFLFQDKDIIQLLKQATQRGVAVFIISNIRLNDYREGDDENSQDSTLPNLNDLKDLGCHVHLLKELHAKFIIGDGGEPDGEEGIIMSANFSSNSIGKNTETGVFVYEDDLEELEYIFEKLYLSSDVTDISRSGDRNTLSKSYKAPEIDLNKYASSDVRFTIASKEIDNNLKGFHIHTIYDSVLNIIKTAQQHLFLVSWHFNSLNNLPGFLTAIKDARDRGVNVYVYSNMMGASKSLNSSKKEIRILSDMGCKVFGDNNNHSKCVLNEKEGILFTANIDGYRGMLNGFEVGCMFTKMQRSAAYSHIMSLISIAKNKMANGTNNHNKNKNKNNINHGKNRR